MPDATAPEPRHGTGKPGPGRKPLPVKRVRASVMLDADDCAFLESEATLCGVKPSTILARLVSRERMLRGFRHGDDLYHLEDILKSAPMVKHNQ